MSRHYWPLLRHYWPLLRHCCYYIESINDFNIFCYHNITLLLYHNILLSHYSIIILTYSVIIILHYYFIIIFYYHLIQLLLSLLLLQIWVNISHNSKHISKKHSFLNTHALFCGGPWFLLAKKPLRAPAGLAKGVGAIQSPCVAYWSGTRLGPRISKILTNVQRRSSGATFSHFFKNIICSQKMEYK